MTTLPIASSYTALAQDNTIDSDVQHLEQTLTTESGEPENHAGVTNGLIADLAWILLLSAAVTLLFKML